MLQNERRCNLMKKDRLIALTDAVLVFKLFGIYGKISLLIFFPFSGWDRYGWH